MKKVLCFVLAAVLVMSCFAGCGGIDKKKLVGKWQGEEYWMELKADNTVHHRMNGWKIRKWDVINDDVLVLYDSSGDLALSYNIEKLTKNELVLGDLGYAGNGSYTKVDEFVD